jgi:two-component system sensor histidine kinase BaeS
VKKKRNGRSSLRLRFILICMSQLVLVAALSELAGWAFRHWFGVTPELPIFVWAMVFSGTIGVAVTNHMTKMLIDPIAKLRSAMREVADGDFKVEAKCESRIQDVQDIYDSFNSMVRELSTTETLQTDFISDVSHEFKTPINAIEGYASLLEGEPSPEEQRAYVEKILFNTRRLSALTGNILLLSKLSNQSILPQKTQFRLDEQIRQAIVALEQMWSEKELGFEVELAETPFFGYESLLPHVWTNLIGNAVKFSPKGGEIRIKMMRTEGAVVFTIEDDGPGIVPGDEEHIFTKFYQSESSHGMEGNGLGLALVRQIVEMSGGSVDVQNLEVGGCRFTVRLPLEQEKGAAFS